MLLITIIAIISFIIGIPTILITWYVEETPKARRFVDNFIKNLISKY